MRILLVSPFLPYASVPHAGGKLVHHLLLTLLRSHSLFLVTRFFPGEAEHAARVGGTVSGIAAVPAPPPMRRGTPSAIAATILSYVRLARTADEVVRRERFDLCQVEFTETGVFWTPPRSLPSVITCHDIIAKPAFRRYLSARGKARAPAWAGWRIKFLAERRALGKFRRVLTLSDADREWGEKLYPGVPFRVLRYPGGLDCGPVSARSEVPGRVLFIGALNRPQNVEAVRFFAGNIWPAVRDRVASAEFRVVGAGASDDFRRELGGESRIRVTGAVENIAEEHASAAVFVAPVLAGGGIIVKILDAMAAGVPVVTTAYGNEGIRAQDGREIIVADRPGEFADAVISLLDDPARRKAIGEAGRRFVEARFSREGFERTLHDVHAEAVGEPRPRTDGRKASP